MTKCLRGALLAAAIIFADAPPAAADLASAYADYRNGNYEAAFQEFRRLADTLS